MIIEHATFVPHMRRAERVTFDAFPVGGTVRTMLRPVFCPACRSHRTMVVNAAAWSPCPGVKHVRCDACTGGRP